MFTKEREMNIEEIFRQIVREEINQAINSVLLSQMKSGVEQLDDQVEKTGKTLKEVYDDIAEKEEAEPVQEELEQVSNTAELMAAIKEACSGTAGLGKKAKAIVTALGYDKFSTVPDDEAQEVYHKVMGELK